MLRAGYGRKEIERALRRMLPHVERFRSPRRLSLASRLDRVSPALSGRSTRPFGELDVRLTDKKPPKAWDIYPGITNSDEAASDNAAVFVDIDI